MKNTALITGITGQDGCYLSKLLLEKGYTVIGVTRSYSGINIKNLSYLGIDKEVLINECDMYDIVGIINLIREHKPTHIYNLAAQSSVRMSFEQPIGTIKYNIESVLNLLEAIRLTDTSIHFYQASSSEMYGKVDALPVSLNTHINPVSPYAVSKASAFMLVNNYRNAYNLFAVNGVLFNHESFLRTNNFFVKKVIMDSIRLKENTLDFLKVGNIDIRRDFGYAPKYVEAMYLSMIHDNPENYMVCSGRSVSLRDIIYHVFDRLQIDRSKIKEDADLLRPDEIRDLYGNNDITRKTLNWDYDADFFSILDLLLEEELRNSAK